jgi:hypothetical protein
LIRTLVAACKEADHTFSICSRSVVPPMFRSTLLAALLAAAAAPVAGNDGAARAQLYRQQQSDAFALQLQQSVEAFRAGPLTPQQRIELESVHRGQQLRQADQFYRQQVQQTQTLVGPRPPAASRAELMRFQQERQGELDRARAESAVVVDRNRQPEPRPAPNPEPTVIWGPVLR